MRAMATRWRMPPESSCGYLSVVLDDIETDPGDPAPGMLVALAARHALAFEAEGDIVEHGPVIEAGVILKDHAPVGARSVARGRPITSTSPLVGGCWGPRPAISRRIVLLPHPLGPENAHELALVDQILHDERHMANGCEFVGAAGIVGLGDVAELDHVRFPNLTRLTDARQNPTHADLLDRRGARRWWWLPVRFDSWRVRFNRDRRADAARTARLSALASAARRMSSQACSTARTSRFKIPMPP